MLSVKNIKTGFLEAVNYLILFLRISKKIVFRLYLL